MRKHTGLCEEGIQRRQPPQVVDNTSTIARSVRQQSVPGETVPVWHSVEKTGCARLLEITTESEPLLGLIAFSTLFVASFCCI